jgi:hypothetical protein
MLSFSSPSKAKHSTGDYIQVSFLVSPAYGLPMSPFAVADPDDVDMYYVFEPKKEGGSSASGPSVAAARTSLSTRSLRQPC